MPDTKSSYAFVPRIKGTREVVHYTADEFTSLVASKKHDDSFTLQEYLIGSHYIKPYLDADHKITSPVDDATLEKLKEEILTELEDIVEKLFPGLVARYAQRHGPLPSATSHWYKISYRVFVQGIKCKCTDIPNHIRNVLSLSAKETHKFIDLGVYKDKEQLLGVIYGRKDLEPLGSRRVLLPLNENDPIEDFLVQNVHGISNVLNASAGSVTKSGRKRQKVSKVTDDIDQNIPGGVEILEGDEYATVLQAASEYFGLKYRMQEKLKLIQVNRDDKYLIFPTTHKWCFIKAEVHASNNPYITVTDNGARWKCFDDECKNVEVKMIPRSELPSPVRDLYAQTFYGVVCKELMTEAKVECRKNITDNFPEETPGEVDQVQNTLMTIAKRQICRKCHSSRTHFEHQEKGWCIRCLECDNQWPNDLVRLPKGAYPKLVAALKQMNVMIGSVNIDNSINNNVTNIYHGTGDAADFYADFSADNLAVFGGDAHLNELFIASLRGTDLTLSKFATELFKDRFHCTSQKQWYRFDGHCWSDDAAELSYKEAMSTDEFLHPYRQVAMYFEGQAMQTDEVKRKARMVRKLCIQLEDGKQREKIVTDSILKFHDRRPTFARDLNTQNIMVFKDGVYSFDTFTFGPGHPDVPVTMQVQQPFIPYSPGNEHVTFLMQFMTDILPDPAVREYTLKVLGICLTLDTSQQLFYVWTGSGGNGKGRLLTLMEKCLGVYYQAVGPTFLTRKREDANQANEALMSLRSVRLAVFQEPEAKDVLQAATIKSMTGEDTISTRENYGRQVKFTPKFKSLLVCNDIPNVSESTTALWRRFRVVHFPTMFVENPTFDHERKIDVDLNQKLEAAAPYFIGILIHHYRLYKMEGLKEPPAVTAATNKYKDSVDKIKEFVEERLCRTEDPDYVLDWKDLNEAFAKRYGQMNRDTLRRGLAEHKVVYRDSTIRGVRYLGFKGWKLK